MIERVQKSELYITLGDDYCSYVSALKEMNMETLFERRRKLCLKFAKKSLKSPKFSNWFKVNEKQFNSRSTPPKYCEVYSRCKRYEMSPISYLTKLLNNYIKQ